LTVTETWIEDLLQEIDQGAVVDLVAELISIPSVNPKDAPDCQRWGITPGEGKLAGYLCDRLNVAGLETQLEELAPGRSNLVAMYKGSQPGPRLVFNAHMDTVGAYEMAEKAFLPEVKNKRLYGRGAADMKGALGCFAATLEGLAKHRVPLRGEVVLTAVIGEEGPPSGTEYLVRQGFQADGAVVGEASGCRLFLGQRGGQFVRLRTFGKAAHGSMPHAGENAIARMVNLLASIPDMPLFQNHHPQFGSPTCTIGTIRGGVRTNVIPDCCEATLDVRIPPDILPADVLAAFKERLDLLQIHGEAEPEEAGHPAYQTRADTRIAQAAINALSALNADSAPDLAPYWSDLAYLHGAGIQSIVLGPGNILQAHSSDEYVEIDQLVLATKIYLLIALNFCGGQ
jgi:acetylornithine deacetylase/succinyl-diaminopimelate desuccinylase-like protein